MLFWFQQILLTFISKAEFYQLAVDLRYCWLLWLDGSCVYYDVIVQVADDADFVTNVRTLFNNDDDNSAGFGFGSGKHYVEAAEGKLIDAGGVSARYVRLYSNGNSENRDNHYVEVEVFGKPVN